VLFLDEPTAGLDPGSRTAMWDEIGRLAADDGLTILLTTHYLEEAQALADRVAIVKDGRILAEGAPRELGTDGGPYLVTYRNGDGSLIERQTDDPTTLLNELTSAALARGERLQDLTVSRPTLEDVYLELTASEEPGDG